MYITKKNKKAQMEIMGLVIIVILIALLMLFVVNFVARQEPNDLKKTYTHSQLASNSLTTLVKTTTNCKDRSINELLQNCASGANLICNNGQNSCQAAESVITEILEKTLKNWNKDYEFLATSSQMNIHILEGECTGEKRAATNPIPGGIDLKLDICG